MGYELIYIYSLVVESVEAAEEIKRVFVEKGKLSV